MSGVALGTVESTRGFGVDLSIHAQRAYEFLSLEVIAWILNGWFVQRVQLVPGSLISFSYGFNEGFPVLGTPSRNNDCYCDSSPLILPCWACMVTVVVRGWLRRDGFVPMDTMIRTWHC